MFQFFRALFHPGIQVRPIFLCFTIRCQSFVNKQHFFLYWKKGLGLINPCNDISSCFPMYVKLTEIHKCVPFTAVKSVYISVCVSLWLWLLLYTGSWQFSPCMANVAWSSFWPCSREASIAPLSFTAPIRVGASICPDCIWLLRASVAAKPWIFPCKSLRGKSQARQQENEQCGSFHHSRR